MTYDEMVQVQREICAHFGVDIDKVMVKSAEIYLDGEEVPEAIFKVYDDEGEIVTWKRSIELDA